jgi:hypothetical protein
MALMAGDGERSVRKTSARKSSGDAVFRAARVRLQALAVGEDAGGAAEHLRAGLGDLEDAGPLLEVVDAERRWRTAPSAMVGSTWLGPAQ